MNADEQSRKEAHGELPPAGIAYTMPLIIYRWRVGQRSELFLPRSRWKDAAVLSDISMRVECVCICVHAYACVCVYEREKEERFVKVYGEKRAYSEMERSDGRTESKTSRL